MNAELKLGSLTIRRFDPKIVGVVGGENFANDSRSAIEQGADIIEARIDKWETAFGDASRALPDLKEFRENNSTPIIGTIYRTGEIKDAGFSGTEDERALLFIKVMEYIDAVDIGYKVETREKVINEARKRNKTVILSHVLKGPEVKKEDKSKPWLEDRIFKETMEEMLKIEADCYKVTTEGRAPEDMITHMYALVDTIDKYPNKPTVGISTAVNGMLSRVLFPLLGSYFTYGFLKHEPEEGRVGIKWLRNTLNLLKEAVPLIEDTRKMRQIPPVILETLR